MSIVKPFTHAIVLAAGLGKRMRPLTEYTPKPMIKVSGRTLIDRALDQLEPLNLERVVVNTSYLADQLESHVAKRHLPPVVFSREAEPLETGGGIANALHLLGEKPFISMNSDTICLDGAGDGALLRMAKQWDPSAMDVLMLLHPREKAIGYPGAGDFVRDEETGRMRRRGSDATAPYVFTGVQIINPALFADCPSGAFSMNRLYDRLLGADGYFTRIASIVHSGDWLHVGDPQGLADAERFLSHHM